MDELLAGILQSYPAIWDRKHVHFKNKVKKQQAFADLALILKTTPDIAEGRYWALREKYRKEKAKQQKAERSGAGSDFEPWCLMETLSFLDSVMTTRRTISNLESTHSQGPLSAPAFVGSSSNNLSEEPFTETETDTMDETQDQETETLYQPLRVDLPSTSTATATKSITTGSQKIKRKREKEDPSEEVMNRLATAAEQYAASQNHAEGDEYDHFGKFIANAIRKLNANYRDDCVLDMHKVLHKYKKM